MDGCGSTRARLGASDSSDSVEARRFLSSEAVDTSIASVEVAVAVKVDGVIGVARTGSLAGMLGTGVADGTGVMEGTGATRGPLAEGVTDVAAGDVSTGADALSADEAEAASCVETGGSLSESAADS